MDKSVDILEHYGIKGMRWGVRRSRAQIDADSSDTIAVKEVFTKVKSNSGSTGPLSNKELQLVITRLNLEQQYSNLTTQANAKKKNAGQKFASDIIQNVAKKQITRIANDMLAEQVNQYMKK